MWIFIPEGFYSIVTAEEFGHPLQVRARSEADLDRLRSTYFPKLGPNVAIPGRDYPWRACTTPDDLAECLIAIAKQIDYSNFKNEVAARLGSERAHIYGKVWAASREIETESPAPTRKPTKDQSVSRRLADRTNGYRTRDLHAEGQWPPKSHRRYGGVIFNENGEVLLRESKGHFGGFVWTFSKGAPDVNESRTGHRATRHGRRWGEPQSSSGTCPAFFRRIRLGQLLLPDVRRRPLSRNTR